MPSQDVEELVRWAYDWFNRECEPPPTFDGERRTRRLEEFFDRAEALRAVGLGE
jgi:hypothetical protein